MRLLSNRYSRILAVGGWLAVVVLAARSSAKAPGTTPEHLLGIVVIGYLASWGGIFLVSGSDPRQRGFRFLATTLSIVGVVFLFELPAVLGLVDYRILFSTPTPPWQRPGYEPDSSLLYVRKGSQRIELTFGGAETCRLVGDATRRTYRCTLQLDAAGFRNLTSSPQADLIVLGDSFIEGLQVSDAELLTSQIARLSNWTVVNLGRTGYGPQQELEVLRRHGIGLRPNWCIWAFYEGNDLQDLSAYEGHRRNVERLSRQRWNDQLYVRSFARNCLGFLIRTAIRPEPRLPARLYSGRMLDRSGRERQLHFATGVQHGTGSPTLPREDSTELKLYRSILQEAHQECARNGIRLMVVLIPSKFRVYRDVCAFDAESPCPGWPVDDLPAALRSLVGGCSAEIEYLDLTPDFQREAAQGAVLYLEDDTHWSPEGHALAAARIWNALANRPANPGLLTSGAAATFPPPRGRHAAQPIANPVFP